MKKQTIEVYDRVFPKFARPAIHPKVSDILNRFPRGSLLDLPSGSGALSYRLSKEGFCVTACDIRPEQFKPIEIPVVAGDLRRRFPFDDNLFDYATFVEGPEHSENPLFAFREFARVLKPGGRLIVTLPNYTNIEQRLRYLFFGSTEKCITQERLQNSGGIASMLHITPLGYTQLRFFLETAGFEIELIEQDVIKKKQYLLKPLAMTIQLISKIADRGNQAKYWASQANSNKILMGGNTLIVMARHSENNRL